MADQIKEKFDTPTVFVIFGATGDLARGKLYPALFDLFRKGLLPDTFQIVGYAHTDRTSALLQEIVGDIIACDDEVCKNDFLARISYVRGGFDDPEGFESLAKHLQEIDDRTGQCSNKLFHLAIPPYFYENLLGRLADSGLAKVCDDTAGWTRILIEKPFGRDAVTARQLDQRLAALFKEEQIYRIDHYLAKETVQNIMMFRFANAVFAPAWSDAHIEKITVDMSQDIDVGTRGAFYDDIGALRDVGQNHGLQLLAAVTMEEPQTFAARDIRQQRADILKKLKLDVESATRGQYAGFRELKGVKESSETETFFHLNGFIDTDRWRNTEIEMTGGKALEEQYVRLTITFRAPEHDLCVEDGTQHKNKIIIDIQPEENITVSFLAKKHGFGMNLTEKNLDFSFHSEDTGMDEIDAYERVLHDAVIGEQILFASTDEVSAAWSAMMPILDGWGENPLVIYDKGSAVDDILHST